MPVKPVGVKAVVEVICSPTVSDGACVAGAIVDVGALLTVMLAERLLMRTDLLLELAFRLAPFNVTVPVDGNATGTTTVHESF